MMKCLLFLGYNIEMMQQLYKRFKLLSILFATESKSTAWVPTT